jgi:hypothetical protein
MSKVERIRLKYEALAPVMDERMERLWAAAEAMALGRGGTAAVAKATGILGKRILAGRRDLMEFKENPPARPAATRRTRRPGGGRKALETHDPGLISALEALIDPIARGDFHSPLRWTCKSVRRLAADLTASAHPVGATKVRKVLSELGYSLRGNRKAPEGPEQGAWAAQFEYINAQASAFQARRQPVIWVQTKRKAIVERAGNGTHVAESNGAAEQARPFNGKAVKQLRGEVYELFHDEDGWVNAGIDEETAEFAVESIQRWWRRVGKLAYPEAADLLLTADMTRGPRARVWKLDLQRLANQTGLRLHVCHCPPGTSKWNKVEHRLYCHMSENSRDRRLESVEAVVSLIGGASSEFSLGDHDGLDDDASMLDDHQRAPIFVRAAPAWGDWNYRIDPNVREQSNGRPSGETEREARA